MLLLLAWLTRNRETGTAYAFEIQATSVADGLLRSLRFGAIAMAYVGLFVAPLGIARLWQLFRNQEDNRGAACVFVALYTVASFALFWYPGLCRMPFLPSCLYDLGLSP